MENKFYLNKEGIASLLKKLSTSIKNHTTADIEFEEILDQDTGEITKTPKNPENFTSVHSVVEYLRNRSNIRIRQDSSSNNPEGGYEVDTNEIVYNGEQEVQINIALATTEDINKLF